MYACEYYVTVAIHPKRPVFFLSDLYIPTLVYSNFVVSHKSLIVHSNLLALNESHTAVHALIASNLQMRLYILIMKIYQGVETYNLYLPSVVFIIK